ncbi:MAG: CehA/McbA family metallohydrolase [Pseudomonadota bacterium]
MLLTLLLLAACHPPADTAAPAPPPDLTERLGADEARAGMLAEGDDAAFVGGVAGESQPGDYLLYNDRARFVVRGLRQGDWYVGEPGSLIDLDIVRPEGQADRDGLDELLSMAGFGRLFVAEEIAVLADGSDGGAAVVRARGHDAAIPYIEGMAESPGMFEPNEVEITETYTLEPGSPALRVTTEVHNSTRKDLSLQMLAAGMTDVATFAPFVPGEGVGGEVDGDQTMLAMISRTHDQAWAIYRDDQDLPEGISALGAAMEMIIATGDTLALEEGATAANTRLVGVAADLSTLEEHRRGLRGLPTGVVTGTVTEAGSGEPVAGARVFLTDADGAPWTVAVTDTHGTYRLVGEPGAASVVVVGDGDNEWMELPLARGAYGVHASTAANARAMLGWTEPESAEPSAQADGHGRSEPAALTLTDGDVVTQDLVLPQRGWLHVVTEDHDGAPLPAVVHVSFTDGADPQPPDDRLGEDRPSGGARKTAWVIDGEVLVPVPPGTYDLTAHHGFRYELGRANGVAVTAGGTAEVTLELERMVDTPGWVAIDTHAHATPSIDGQCTIEERLTTAIANDLQLHVSTDHDQVADYRPVLALMGLEDRVVTIPGDEVSSNLRGHHNIYPVEPDPALPNGGAPRWWEEVLSTCELHEEWRERAEDGGILQINHGRSTGMFSSCGYDAEAGEPSDPDFYCDDFDVMEVLNSDEYSEAEQLLRDWVAHLDQGLRPTAIGVSDSHTRLPGTGFPRTYVEIGQDTLTPGDVPLVLDALHAQRAQVSAGPFLRVGLSDGASDVGMGETLTAASATLTLEVFAPSWVPVERVQLLGPSAEVLEEWSLIPEEAEPPLVFHAEVAVSPEADTYYLLRADGSGSLAPVWSGGRPFALSNPVYLEVP